MTERSSAVRSRSSSLRGGFRGRTGQLLVARVVEQGVIGLASLVLAARLGVDAFAPVSALFVINSLAVLLSDFGLGMRVLSTAPQTVAVGTFRLVRLVNLCVAVVAAVAGLWLHDTLGLVVALSGAIWLMSAEAYVRKAALVRLGRVRRVAVSEGIGSTVFALVVVVAVVRPSVAVAWVGTVFILKHVVEALASRGTAGAFCADGEPIHRALHVWVTQLLAYGCANADFLIVGIVISSAAFSVYSLAFRIAAVVTSQVSYAANG